MIPVLYIFGDFKKLLRVLRCECNDFTLMLIYSDCGVFVVHCADFFFCPKKRKRKKREPPLGAFPAMASIRSLQ